MYRQTLTLEIANVKFSTALLKHRLKSKRTLFLMLASALPIAGIFAGRGRVKQAGGLMSKVMSGMKLFGQVAPWIRVFRPAKGGADKRQNITQFP